jgi:hypothetical protein
MHRLEPVAHLGQRAAHDHAHRVIDVAALHLLLDVDGLDAIERVVAWWQRRISHAILVLLNVGPKHRP